MNSISLSSETREVGGYQIRWHRWQPLRDHCRGALFFLHGQGDYGSRYQDIAQFFGEQGLAFVSCDLPGHGESSGKRGHIPSWQLVEELTRMGLQEARTLAPQKPVGLAGHSVGGLLALYLLGELEETPDYCWISSPLLKPGAKQAPWKITGLRLLSSILPRATFTTGVSPEMCRKNFANEQLSGPHFFHSRISLSWAQTLVEVAEVVRTRPERIPTQLPMIVTQGQSDIICPLQFCQELVTRLQRPNLSLQIYPDARHEPFADECQAQVYEDLGRWLREVLLASSTD